MGKNNSKTLKSPSKRPDKESPKNSSTRVQATVRQPSVALNGRETRGTGTSSGPRWADSEFQGLLAEGIDHKNREDFAAATDTFERLVRRFPGSPVANWMLGAHLLSVLKQSRRAIPYFKQAIKANPKSHRCSLGLFHSLWDLDMQDEALEE